MEFSWGLDVFNYGLGSLGATLASRYLVAPFDIIFTNFKFDATNFLQVKLPPNVDAFYQLSSRVIVAGHPHFPYGYNVDPNVPL